MTTRVHTRTQATSIQPDRVLVRPSFFRGRSFRQSSIDVESPAEHGRLYSTGPLHSTFSALEQPRVPHSFARIAVNFPAPRVIQAKLTISQPGDKYEEEADRVADHVMRMPESRLRMGEAVLGGSRLGTMHRTCSKCEEAVRRQPKEEKEGQTLRRQVEEEDEEALRTKPLAVQSSPLIQRQVEPAEEEEEETLQTKLAPGQAHSSGLSADLQGRISSLQGGGQLLPQSLRNYFEPRFGRDFSEVRVHTDARANEVVRAVNARAFTLGNDVVFGRGGYSPRTSGGKRLLAHELTHVVQQNKHSRHYATQT